MKLLQINVTANSGSTGKIAEAIGQLAISRGWESWIAYGRGKPQSESRLIRIGNDWDMRWHGFETRLFDNHGLASRRTTRQFIRQIEEIKPDIIHLHNIHGYYLNYPLLFDYFKQWGGPIVWTLHDIWPLTGHCASFGPDKCQKWRSGCDKCKRYNAYPASLKYDRSHKNYVAKQRAFHGLQNLTLVPVSNWLADLLRGSILSEYPISIIHNGIDTEKFSPSASFRSDSPYVLGVANVWDSIKGLTDFIKLRKILAENVGVKLVGLSGKQINDLPVNIIGIKRTQSTSELSELYSNAIAFINPTWGDNFPTTNIEALACGTPVITYNTGGSPEAIDSNTGIVVGQGDVQGLKVAIDTIRTSTDRFTSSLCRARAEQYFDEKDRFEEYFELYENILINN